MEPAILKDILPCTALQDYVRKYQVFRFTFEKNIIPPLKFHAPRPEHSITFYLRDPQRFSQIDSPLVSYYPFCVVNGMYTVPLYRYGGHDFCAVKVVLQPTALSRLKVIRVKDLTNNYVDGEDCFGKPVSFLCEQLVQANELGDVIVLLEQFLIQLFNQRCKTLEPIDKVSQYILKEENETSLDWLARESCLSVRQFIRKFEEHVGISPKKLLKLSRFNRAVRLKNKLPDRDWLYIALACGYYDYQHLAKDFKEFTDYTPSAFYKIEETSPERSFFLFEC